MARIIIAKQERTGDDIARELDEVQDRLREEAADRKAVVSARLAALETEHLQLSVVQAKLS